jgi:hypothetical protein
VGTGVAIALWPIAAATAVLSGRSANATTSYTAGRVTGAILGSLLLALLVRLLYVKVLARRHERPVWTGSVFVLAFAFSWLAMLGATPGHSETVASCVRDFPAGFLASVPPAQRTFVPDAKLAAAAGPVCEELVRLERENPTLDPAELASLMAHESPDVWRPLCDIRVDIEFASAGSLARYVTRAEKKRFRKDSCRLATSYMSADGTVDTVALLTDHQVIYTPFCAAGFQDGFARDPIAAGDLTPRQIGRIARRACKEALQTRVIDMSVPGGLLNPKIEEDALAAIFQRASRAVR